MKLIKPLLLVVAMLVLADFAFAQNWTLATTITNVAQYSSQGELLMSVASSADGNKLAAGVWNSFNVEVPILSPLYKSTDSGATWLPRFSYQDGFGSFGFNDWGAWNFIVSSADATKLTVISEEESLVYASTNSGIDWAQVSPPGYGLPGPIACSADGHILLAVDANQCLSVSTNSGTSWTPGTDSEIWTSVTVSADGNKMVATSAGRPDAIEVSTNCGFRGHPLCAQAGFGLQSPAQPMGKNSLRLATTLMAESPLPPMQGQHGRLRSHQIRIGFPWLLLPMAASLSLP